MNVYDQIISSAEAMQEELVATRRDFHRHAEKGWLEVRTSSLIARRLTDLGYEVLTGDQVCCREARMGVPAPEILEENYRRALAQGADPEFAEAARDGMTGVIGILRCGEGPTVALRFDIDSLPIVEAEDEDHFPAREGFVSINKGCMHACGHDGHATIGLGTAKLLMELKEHLHGTVKLIFQPAEEGVRGARSIVANGHLDDAQYALGAHIAKRGPTHQGLEMYPGSFGTLATCKYDALYTGKSAHAGHSAHLGSNALLAAASAVVNLQAIPRHGGGVNQINVGTLRAGSGRNVIADEAFMEIEVRGSTTEICDYMGNYAQRVLEHAAAMHGCTCEIRMMGAASSMRSSDALAAKLAEVCRTQLHMASGEGLFPSAGSEDYAYFCNRVQELGGEATFMRVFADIAGRSHNYRYDFSEDALSRGVKIFTAATYTLMQP